MVLNMFVDEVHFQDLPNGWPFRLVNLQAIVNKGLHVGAVLSWNGLILARAYFLAEAKEIFSIERRSFRAHFC